MREMRETTAEEQKSFLQELYSELETVSFELEFHCHRGSERWNKLDTKRENLLAKIKRLEKPGYVLYILK